MKRFAFLALIALLVGCGVFPEYRTRWLPLQAGANGQPPTSLTAALSICETQRDRAEVEYRLKAQRPHSFWDDENRDIDDGFGPVIDITSFGDIETIARAEMTACMADRGWYPQEVCIKNCG